MLTRLSHFSTVPMVPFSSWHATVLALLVGALRNGARPARVFENRRRVDDVVVSGEARRERAELVPAHPAVDGQVQQLVPLLRLVAVDADVEGAAVDDRELHHSTSDVV